MISQTNFRTKTTDVQDHKRKGSLGREVPVDFLKKLNAKREAASSGNMQMEDELRISRLYGMMLKTQPEDSSHRNHDPSLHRWSNAELGDDNYLSFTSNQHTEDASLHRQGIAFTIDGSLPASPPTPAAVKLELSTLGTGIRFAPAKKPHRPRKKNDTPRPEPEPGKIIETLKLDPTPAPPQYPALPSSKPRSRRELKVQQAAASTPETEVETPVPVSARNEEVLKIEPMIAVAVDQPESPPPHREEFGHVLQFDKNRDFGKHRFVPRLFGIETIRE